MMYRYTYRPILAAIVLGLAACNPDKPQGSGEVNLSSVQTYSIPRYGDSASFEKMKDAFPVIDKVFRDYAIKNHFPSIAFGVVAGGKLIFSGTAGQANIAGNTEPTTKTLYRVASMSKSFTAMAILKLRDEGKLSLGDPVSRYIPEMKRAGALTVDAPEITLTNLLTMSAGFPEDNPWGDRQLADTDKELLDLLSAGISFSNVPGVRFEYSNLGFALLGKIISNVSGMPYQEYITGNIMRPIGMNDSKWEFGDVPDATLAHGYRWEDDQWKEEALLHDGSFGAMGGLICSIEDFSRYVALHLDAWPPRNERESGPVKRSTIREMHQMSRFNGLFAQAKTRTGEPCPVTTGYCYGLVWRQDCKGVVRISHSGGLPGFGSEWRIYPDYGIGVVSFSNLTYGAPGLPNAIALDTLIQIAGLGTRRLPPSEIVEKRKQDIVAFFNGQGKDTTAHVFADNFFLDLTASDWQKQIATAFKEAGPVVEVKAVAPENQLRGGFTMTCEKKDIEVYFTLTPEAEALIQQLDLEVVEKEQP